jgi:hypothetical protein
MHQSRISKWQLRDLAQPLPKSRAKDNSMMFDLATPQSL